MSMWGNSIASRVKKVIAQRVETAQKEHDAKKVELQKDMDDKTETHALEMIDKILGK